MRTDGPDPTPIMQLGTGYWASKVVLSAVELGVFGRLASSPADAATLGADLGLAGRGTRAFLDTLVALGLLERDGQTYRNSEVADAFLDPAKPSYLGGYLEIGARYLYSTWGRLTDALRTGQAQFGVPGGDIYTAFGADPALRPTLVTAQEATGGMLGAALAGALDWARYRTFLDVGGAGAAAAELAAAHPHLRGTCVQVAEVEPLFRARVAARPGVGGRLSFLARQPESADDLPAADVVVFDNVLTGLSGERRRALLRHAHRALPPGGAVVVCGPVADPTGRDAFRALLTLNTLLETSSGAVSADEHWRTSLDDAGFDQVKALPAGPIDVLVARRPEI